MTQPLTPDGHRCALPPLDGEPAFHTWRCGGCRRTWLARRGLLDGWSWRRFGL